MRTLLFSFLGLTVVMLSLGVAAQDPPMPAPPTEDHKQLQATVGEWSGTLTSYMPGAPPEPMKASETVKAFGPYWIVTEFQCEFMGTVYKGTGGVGYDPESQKYQGTWMDTMAPHLAVMKGTRDPKTGVLTMNWKSPGPTGEMAPHRYEMKHEGDSYVSHFFMEMDGKWVKTMTIEMKRKTKNAKAGKDTGSVK